MQFAVKYKKTMVVDVLMMVIHDSQKKFIDWNHRLMMSADQLLNMV
jgi:hypothetical protein